MADSELQELKRLVVQVLDADKDGKLSVADAKAIALSSVRSVSARSKAALLSWLDSDGDGAISWKEAETGARGAFHKLEEKCSGAYRKLYPYRTSIFCAGGFVGCFYGQNFKYSILFAKTFATTGWPTVGPALEELRASYGRGKVAFAAAAEDPELRKSAAKLSGAESLTDDDKLSLLQAARGVFLAVDPKKLLKVAKSSYIGLSAAFASVLSESAAKLGLGVSLGDNIADAVNSFCAPVITRVLSNLRDQALTEEDATLRDWVDTVISALSTALGLYVAHRVDDLIYLYSACVAGATLAVDKGYLLLLARDAASSQKTKKQQRHTSLKQAAIWSLAGCGFVYQRILGKGQLPFLLRLPLTPVAICETALSSMALSIRASKAI